MPWSLTERAEDKRAFWALRIVVLIFHATGHTPWTVKPHLTLSPMFSEGEAYPNVQILLL